MAICGGERSEKSGRETDTQINGQTETEIYTVWSTVGRWLKTQLKTLKRDRQRWTSRDGQTDEKTDMNRAFIPAFIDPGHLWSSVGRTETSIYQSPPSVVICRQVVVNAA